MFQNAIFNYDPIYNTTFIYQILNLDFGFDFDFDYDFDLDFDFF